MKKSAKGRCRVYRNCALRWKGGEQGTESHCYQRLGSPPAAEGKAGVGVSGPAESSGCCGIPSCPGRGSRLRAPRTLWLGDHGGAKTLFRFHRALKLSEPELNAERKFKFASMIDHVLCAPAL